MSERRPTPTCACVLTPDGRGAVAVVRVWGPRALEVVDAAFRPHGVPRLADSPRGRLRVGRMGEGPGDEAVAVALDGDQVEVEVHCHGGPAPLALILEALEAGGAERRGPEAWLGRSRHPHLATEAALDLAHAPTVRTAEILVDQLHGAIKAEVRRAIEATSSEVALDILETLLRRSETGLRLLSGWRVVLAGRPNVGKSRLLNALAGYDRAIVDPTPGTTRDVVAVRTALDGWPVELADTAGLRESTDPVEASGIALAREHQTRADLILLVLDRSEPMAEADRALIAEHPDALLVLNKADLPPAWEPWRPGCPTVSALLGDGLDDLISAVAHRLVPDPPPPGSAVPFRPRQVRLLGHARRWLDAGRHEPASRALNRLIGPDPDHRH